MSPRAGCWQWAGALSTDGYGLLGIGGQKNTKAYRVAWELFRGPIPDGLHVLHNCHNRQCVNPSHLRLGTHDENMRDVTKRGSAYGRKLNEYQARAIRLRYRTGRMSQSKLGREYGLTQATVWRILHRKVYA
jgi:hypothetical protein